MTDKQNPKDDDDDFDFSDPVLSNDFNFDLTEEDIRAANNLRENVIKKQNTINDLSEKESEERVKREIAKAQYNQFKQILDDIYEPSSSTGGSNLLYQLANEMELLNGKTFWSYAQAEGRRTKIEEIQYCTWAVLEISKAPIEDRLKVLIMEAINSYIGEMAHGKISWRIALSL
ncbi:hypothetical protein [Pseudomonas tolaasii]|uniref:hypothetical protein n=1 Tax=Pseudomonas tolaasii TaxID=29442 RepID=UPI0015A344D1|nr:hypothetical protein [Pseudomonas tolaasii]NWC42576.1 hypothetical protein [Pseudomonas tolaasii]